MTSLENKSIKNFINHVSFFCFWPKSSRKKIGIIFLKLFVNAIIMNIKIHNILDIIEISKSMEPNKCI
jgi:hypothetical protein